MIDNPARKNVLEENPIFRHGLSDEQLSAASRGGGGRGMVSSERKRRVNGLRKSLAIMPFPRPALSRLGLTPRIRG